MKVLSFLLLSLSLYASSFDFKAYGHTEREAKANALSELAGFLSVKVESDFSNYMDATGAKNISQQLHLSSNLPLGGARVSVQKIGNEYEAMASLDPAFSLRFYESTLKTLLSQIKDLAIKLPGQKGEAKEQTLELLNPLVIDYTKYHAVYKLLGGSELLEPSISSAEIASQLLSLSSEVDTLDMAIKHLTKDLKVSDVYIAPITPDSSHIPTPFSGVFQDKMNAALRGVTYQSEAKELLSGRYRTDKDGMQLTLFLTNPLDGKTLNTRTIRLLPKAYKNFAYQSIDSEFDRAMASGTAVDSSFHASLTTNRGSSDLLFKANDEIKIGIKVNKPGYFYIVAHVKNPKEAMSYLLPIYDNTTGNERFIRYVPASEVNREISLGEFTVEPPYGIESLQLIASTMPITTLPVTKERDGYAVLGEKNIATAVTHTRGLKPKSSVKAQSAEATLSYLTTKP